MQKPGNEKMNSMDEAPAPGIFVEQWNKEVNSPLKQGDKWTGIELVAKSKHCRREASRKGFSKGISLSWDLKPDRV